MDQLALNSAADGIEWPAVPEGAGAAILAILFQLEHSQWWPPERLREAQHLQLTALLDHTWRTVPWYRDRLADAGFQPDAAFPLDSWSRIPVLTRAEVVAAGDDLLSVMVPAGHGRLAEIHTSGSTGRPVRAVRTGLWELFWRAFTLRDHLWHRRDLSGTLAVIRESGKDKAPWPDGSVSDGWGASSGAVVRTGPCASLNIRCSTEQQADWLQRVDPDYLLTHPTVLHGLVAFCLDRGISLPRLRQVETISEILRPGTRVLCEQAWGVPVVDIYSAREAGYLALQCPEHDHYHVQGEGVLVEVIGPDGAPAPVGAEGRVVVTPLHNFAMPLIRYEIGDVAEPGPPCNCGRGLPVLRRILGREQNMLRLPGGRSVWPLLSSSDLAGLLRIAPIRQYQFVQKTLSRIELRIVSDQPPSEAQESDLRAFIRDRFGHPFEVDIVRLDRIPRGATDKYQDFVSELPAEDDP